MADPFVGEIRAFPYTFAPLDWATCDGQMLPPSQNQALFAVIGITYGGNGSTTFALPNLQGRAPMDCGSGTGLTQRSLNDAVGSATVSLTTNNFPSHTHTMNAVSNAITDQAAAANHYLSKTPTAGKPPTSINTFQPAPSSGTQLAVDAAQLAGTATAPVPHDNMQPYLPVQLCIALNGIFPVRP